MTSIHENKRGGAKVKFPPPLVFLGLLGLGMGLQQLLVLPLTDDNTIRWGMTALFALPGIALLVASGKWFHKTNQRPEPWLPSPSMIFEGPYRFSRNPMYLGMTSLQIAIAAALNNLWCAVLAIPALAIVHFIAVLPEERYLAERFGQDYLQFKQRVRRYL